MPQPNKVAQTLSAIPAPETSDPAVTIISARLKQNLITILTIGVPLFDKMTGLPVMTEDADGNSTQLYRPASAAELSVCERMVARASASGAINDHAELQSDLAKMKAMGWKFPELDEQDDEATR